MSEMIHRFDQIADAGNLSPAEMTQIVNANTFAPNAFQSGSQSIPNHLIGQMASAPNRREQQRLNVFRDERIEVMFDIGADMRGNHDRSALS